MDPSSNGPGGDGEGKRRQLELLRRVVLGEEEAAVDVEAALDLPLPGRHELFAAARGGDVGRLERLAERDGGSGALAMELPVSTDGSTALHLVAGCGDGAGHLASASWMVTHGLAAGEQQLLLSRDRAGDTPLHRAARAGYTKMALRLLDLAAAGDAAAAMARARNKDGRTALHEAIGAGDVRLVQELMKKDGKLSRVDADDGTSPLFMAVSLGHHHIARLMQRGDGELSYSGPHGQNALHAALLRDKGMATWLLKETEEGKRKDLCEQRTAGGGSTAMHFAASAEDPSLQFFLFVFAPRSYQSYSPFSFFNYPWRLLYRYYAWSRHPVVLLADADPSAAFRPDADGRFPVHVAAAVGSLVPIVILCYSTGCAGLRDPRGRTFLHVAVEKKMLNVVRFVCGRSEFKSVLNVQDNGGSTALHLAVHGGDWDIFKTLICNQHVRLNLPDGEGRTPMDIAQIKAPLALGFYFGMHARRRIPTTLTFANAQRGNRRRDHFMEGCALELDDEAHRSREAAESEKITSFAQIVGIGSVLVATATFAAAFTMPGGYNQTDAAVPPKGKGGTPMLAGLYAFDGFVVANTLAFICSALATFNLIYVGVAAVDIHKRIKLVSFSLALLIGAARSFCAAFAFALYVLLAPVSRSHKAAFASIMLIALALLDAFWFMAAIWTDATLVLRRARVKLKENRGWRSVSGQLLRLLSRFVANIGYMFWPYIVIFGLLASRNITAEKIDKGFKHL